MRSGTGRGTAKGRQKRQNSWRPNRNSARRCIYSVKGLDRYPLGPDDQVVIHVVDLNEIRNSLGRLRDWAVFVSIVGSIQAQGLTEEVLSAPVRERVKRVLVDPDVTVSTSN